MIKIDLIMFKGIDEVGSNIAAWRGDKPTMQQLDVLQKYIDDNREEKNEFI